MNAPVTLPGIDPQMAQALAKNAGFGTPDLDITTAPIADVRANYLAGRAFWNADRPDIAVIEDRRIAGPFGEIPVRHYRANTDGVLPLLVYFHGGGFIIGNLDSHDKICRLLAIKSGAAVIAVDYRLAPEFKFPTPLIEGRVVIDWSRRNAGELGIDPARIALGGDSAGASISLGIAVEMKQERSAGVPLPDWLRLLVLVYGNYGLVDSDSIRRFGAPEFGLSDKNRAFYRACYLQRPADREDPRLNQLGADLDGLPRCAIAAAELDPLCDNSPALAAKLAEAGVAHSCKIYPGVLHGFLHYTRMVDRSVEIIDDLAAELESALGSEARAA